ncbi:hypothetical protein [Cupriavidus necator]|uniref:hypothetical protein n=1 Tax=Cupriavidus necator TaxID=106590 RepID=UPI001305431F|nr:hypothetical protein [Cupriavidus necator]MDX6011343.1 hypothetical protein [Cupriavidus necator]
MDLPVQSIESLREAGQKAAVKGARADANPFPPYSGHYRQWEHGHVWQLLDPRSEEGV